MSKFEPMLSKLTNGLRAAVLEHVSGNYREYCLWALSDDNPLQTTWLNMMGIPQFIQLTLGLLDGLVDDTDWERLSDFSVVMNLYLIFEVVSDDLAIGLAYPAPEDLSYENRRALLQGFNDAMIQRLQSDDSDTLRLLMPLQPTAEAISGFAQTLSPDKHHALAQIYRDLYDPRRADGIEHAIWPRLLANIETCHAVAQAVSGCQLGPIVAKGLMDRYRAVSAMLDHAERSIIDSAAIGIDTILVVPVLAYYICVLIEILQPTKNLERVIGNGILEEALRLAALQVRLLNDVGPGLLMQDAAARSALFEVLRFQEHKANTLGDMLLSAVQDIGPLLTRIHKDLAHGEFNICLNGIRHLQPADGLDMLENRLAEVSDLYRDSSTRLDQLTRLLTQELGTPTPSCLIQRFVRFHEMLYALPYNESVGEYAV